jgi:hypothetical protein
LVVVLRSLPRFLARLLLLPVGVTAAVLPIVGVGTILYLAVGAAAALSVICFAVMAVSQRPRVVITPGGFTFHKLFGRLAHQWEDIDGPFVAIKIGWSKTVAYQADRGL